MQSTATKVSKDSIKTSDSIDTNTQMNLRPKRVLLAEDDEVSQQQLPIILSRHDVDIQTVTDGNAVLSQLKAMEFDLIILDLHLPPFNVLELSKMIREELNLNIPIIGLSSANMNGRAIEAGVNMVFRKPLDNTHIQEAIRTSLFQN